MQVDDNDDDDKDDNDKMISMIRMIGRKYYIQVQDHQDCPMISSWKKPEEDLMQVDDSDNDNRNDKDDEDSKDIEDDEEGKDNDNKDDEKDENNNMEGTEAMFVFSWRINLMKSMVE